MRGALVTNFRLIKAGAIHRANGGYLLLDARSVLLEPFSWAALKRTLRQGKIAIEDIGRFLRLHQHGVAGTGSDPAQREGHPVWRPVAVFSARRL